MNLSSIQPIVLVGGQSRRFGRDKLREPHLGGWLIDRPIAALREVFGPRIAVVGDCHPEVAGRADLHIPDRYPGLGPLGGIAAAIESCWMDIFVLPGDARATTGALVRTILDAAADDALAVLAQTDRVEACIGLYRRECLALLQSRLSGSLALHDAIPAAQLRLVPIDPALAANVNTPADLAAPPPA